MRTAVAIAARGLAKRFGHVDALTDASVEVAPGEVVALVGDNGAGKTTLLHCLLGIETADAGQIEVPEGVGCVHQELALAPDLSVSDNMFLGHELLAPGPRGRFGALDRGEMRRRAETALAELGIEVPSVAAQLRELSGGQRQAVAVARAVMWSRTAVLMDEPTAALGAHQSDLVCALIRRVAERGLGVLVVSHDLPRVLGIADRVVVLWRGSTIQDTPAEGLTVPDVIATMVGYRA
jgi:ABC-type sugar transport system ATPase subunit